MTSEQKAALREAASKATQSRRASEHFDEAHRRIAQACKELGTKGVAVLALLDECERMRAALVRLSDLASFEAGTVNPGQPFWDALAQARAALGDGA